MTGVQTVGVVSQISWMALAQVPSEQQSVGSLVLDMTDIWSILKLVKNGSTEEGDICLLPKATAEVVAKYLLGKEADFASLKPDQKAKAEAQLTAEIAGKNATLNDALGWFDKFTKWSYCLTTFSGWNPSPIDLNIPADAPRKAIEAVKIVPTPAPKVEPVAPPPPTTIETRSFKFFFQRV